MPIVCIALGFLHGDAPKLHFLPGAHLPKYVEGHRRDDTKNGVPCSHSTAPVQHNQFVTRRNFNGPDRHPFGPGDVLFVPAGVEHRFEDFGAPQSSNHVSEGELGEAEPDGLTTEGSKGIGALYGEADRSSHSL